MELKYEFYIDADPQTVWDTFMTPEGTRKIFFGSELRSSFKVGEPYEYVGPGEAGEETVHVYGIILALEPLKVFSALEHPGPTYRENHAELQSRITLTLDTVGKCTKLTLVNDQWTPDHPSFESTRSSWWMILSNIKTLAETGKTLDFGF
jgi:uncharacterized protein YndB with AHSA1/START domain